MDKELIKDEPLSMKEPQIHKVVTEDIEKAKPNLVESVEGL